MTPLTIAHVDLTIPRAAVPEVEPGRALLLVLWAGTMPLGELRLERDHLPSTDAQLCELLAQVVAPVVAQRVGLPGFEPALPELRPSRPPQLPARASAAGAVEAPLDRLRREPDGSGPAVSVVLCTRDRPQQLERALRSIVSARPTPAEVVVVDNAPTDDATRAVVAAFPDVRYVLEPRPGLSAARNAGVSAARGQVIAFTDDDVVVHPAWVGRLQQAFDDQPAVLAVTGLVLPAALETDGQLLFELHVGGFGHDYRRLVFDPPWFAGMRYLGAPVWRVGAGANMAFRREAFSLVGGFDERLGAGAAGCSEDSELWYRLLAAGHSCVYEPAAVVHHHHRSDAVAVRQQSRAYLDGHVSALLVQYARHGHAGNLRRALVTLPRFYAARAAHAVRRPDVTLLDELRGCASGLRRAPRLLRFSPPPGEPTVTERRPRDAAA